MSDGGIKNSGDVVKAFSAGAQFVMLGGVLSGHEECLGEVMEKNNKKYKVFYGMASETAMNKYQKTSSLNSSTYKCAEGKTVMVPYRGPVEKNSTRHTWWNEISLYLLKRSMLRRINKINYDSSKATK